MAAIDEIRKRVFHNWRLDNNRMYCLSVVFAVTNGKRTKKKKFNEL